jgi:uncharacterized protein involved in outer membrane biogenesis
LVGCAALAAVIAAIPWLVPLSGFIPQVEDAATERLGVPVSVGELHLTLLPLPHVTAKDVNIGERKLGSVKRIRVWPALLHLLSDEKVIREVRLEGVMVTQDLAERLLSLRSHQGPRRARIERIVVKGGELRLRATTIRDVSADVDLDEDGRVIVIHADSAGRLRLAARPDADKTWSLDIAATDWTPPLGPAVQFDRIDASAVLNRQGIQARNFVARLYGGRITGALSVAWKPEWSVIGDLQLESVRLQPLATLIATNRSISGRLRGNPRFIMQAKHAADLAASMELSSDFVIEDGVLQKIDLVAATRNPLAAKPKDGQTRFDELSGHLDVDPRGYHFSDLKVASGLLRAIGEVSVTRDQKLDGRINAELRGTASLLAVPLNVSGTVQDPSVAPTTAAVAGAIAGSVLLPGIGTAVGIKASELTDRLFGGRRDRPAKSAPQPATGGR